MDKKIFVFLGFFISSVVVLIIAGSAPLTILPAPAKLLLLLVSMALDILAFSSRYYTYLLLPFMQQRSSNIVLSNEDAYWLSTASDSVIRKDGEDYIATVYIRIPVYRSATEMSDDEKLDFSRRVSRLVGISKSPARYTAELHMMNKDYYIQQLRDTISKVENEEVQLVQNNGSPGDIERVRGKLAMWHNILDHIGGVQSFELTHYATVSARGAKEYEAVSIAQQDARELLSGIGSTFGVTPSIVTGKELLNYIEPEYLIPFSTISEQISKNVQEEVI
ncbi:MAG: hypothetical protein KGH98_00840 [Candidatus Micrarchaeota archaeon]|nr:hypothetical protein [Candidatus Micrarchaeota archaeon]